MATKKASNYYIVNKSGTIHQVNKARQVELLAVPGYRVPTKAELDAYKKSNGIQQINRPPLAAPFNPEAVPEAAAVAEDDLDKGGK